MLNWKKVQKQITLITLNSKKMNQKRISRLQFKMLPSLKKIVQVEPVNFINYQRAKRNRRVQLDKPIAENNLFLQGQQYTAIPYQFKSNKPKAQHSDFSTMPNLDRKVAHPTSQQIATKNSQIHSRNNHNHYSLTIKQGSLQLRHSQSKNTQEKVHVRRKITNNSNLVQIKKKAVEISPVKVNSNKSLTAINKNQVTIEKQKPMFFLQKKQLDRIKAQSFIVMEYPSLKMLTANRHKNVAEIASLTKIMTFYTVHQLCEKYRIDVCQEIVIVNESASNMTGTSAQLVCGDVLTVEQLLYGLMLPSGNDAAVALATWGGKLGVDQEDQTNINPVQNFLSLMNKYGKELELKNSNFANPHGLPNFRNTSTPYDVAMLTAQCLKIPLFLKIVNTQTKRFWIKNSGVKKQMHWENTNKLIRREGFIGVKTGVTVIAGPCLATCYQHGDKKFIVVLLRTSKLSRRFKETRMILGWTLKKYDKEQYGQAAKKILKHDVVLDSDNSEDEDEFCYDRMDAQEIAKRNKILQNQL